VRADDGAVSAKSRIAAGLGAALALLVVGGVFSYRSTAALAQASGAAAATHVVLSATSDLRARLGAAESARRGYVLTGDRRFEAGYQEAVAASRRAGRMLASRLHAGGGPAAALPALVERKLAQLDDSMALYRRSPGARAEQAALTLDGHRSMEDVEAALAQAEGAQRAELETRERQAQRASSTALRVVPAANGLALVLIAACGLLLLREAARRRSAQDTLRASEARYRAVLSHFPNGAVFLYDDDLRYCLVEGMGLADVGLTKEGLEGRVITELFPPETLAHIEGPYRAALAGQSSVLEVPYGGRMYVVRITPIRDERGAVTHGLVVTQDVSQEKEADERTRRLTADLERAVSEMKAANEELEAFSYSVSHDLRAPLRHVHGFVDLLRRSSHDRLDETGQRQLDTIARAARTMGQLIDDLLTLSRVTRAPARREAVDLGFLVREVVQPLGLEAGEARIHWDIGPLPRVEADPGLLRVVLTNLLDNAVKYSRTQAHPRIEVGSMAAPDGLAGVYVRDNGVGFDMQYAGKLFGVFQRLHRPEDFEGTGIGLATVRRIVQRHGGRTWAEGRPGEGATFYFTLPLADTEPPAAAERSAS
jgi:PAS domain S-box-containing protein